MKKSSLTFADLDSLTISAFEAVRRVAVELADIGFLAGIGGNIAYRIKGSQLVVTPSGLDYYAMQVQDLCLLDLHTLEPLYAKRSPSIESGLHAAILRKRPDCFVSIHTHQTIASAFSLGGKSLYPRDAMEREVLGSVVPISGYALSGTKWLTNKVAALVSGASNAYLMRNHGVVCLGVDFSQAVTVTKVLETACADWFAKQISESHLPTTDSPLLPKILNHIQATPA